MYYDFLIERDCGSVDRVADPWARGADVVIEKPFSVDELRELIQRVGADVPAGQYGAQQA